MGVRIAVPGGGEVMSHIGASKPARARALLVTGSLVALGITTALSASASGATPSPLVHTGEGEPGGPRSAPVDPDHASPAAARRAAMEAHGHHAMHTTAEAREGSTAAATAAALDPAVYGQWSTLSYKLPLRAIHATLLHTGQFLLIAGSGNVANDNVIKNFKAYLWDPITGALTSVPVPYDAFCAGHLVDRTATSSWWAAPRGTRRPTACGGGPTRSSSSSSPPGSGSPCPR
jgi:hypothetical protein